MVEQKKVNGADLEAFEQAVYLRQKENRIEENNKAVMAMHSCLVQLRHGAGFAGHGRIADAEITRFCSAVTALMLDPQMKLTIDGFNFLLSEKAVLDTVFRSSVYGGTDYIYQILKDSDDAENATKLLLLFSPNSPLEFNLERVFREDPQATIGLYLSLVGYAQVMTPQGHARREQLLGLAGIFEDVELPQTLWNAMCSAYMHCSYASGDHKHDCKRVFHKLLAKPFVGLGLGEPPVLVSTERPKIVCILEWWRTPHAMFRSYARSIQQLRKRFHIVGVCVGTEIDEPAKQVFDEFIQLSGDNLNMAELIQRIRGMEPEIMYFPSIGMGVWSIALASVRLAPIQIMGYGHPATSNSPEIDYGIIESDCLTESRFSERMVGIPPNTVRPSALMDINFKHEPKAKDRIRIGVAAMQVKVTYPFVQVLQEVQKRSKKPIDLVFFGAAHGIGLYSMAKDLASQLQNVLVQEMQQYEEYMRSLSECDIVLFSIPFGGANSAYDAVTLGLPMVSLKGEQPHSMSDASIIKRVGLPDFLVTHCTEDYIRRIVEMAEDDEKRIAVAKQTAAVDLNSQFYAADESDVFLKTFERIYEENCVYGVMIGERKAA